ncbi:MAG: hypothetical protein ACR2LL_06110 [Nitrosopumilus sp.]|uniref:hypothetical protein n=1 Tax=Nitrosopumilus sp. TaxID=2024843 RepID=UPI00292DF296|nr:hypothetical protein [Nitrosopumilus sp.]
MLDKSSDQILDNNLIQIQSEFERKTPNIILCSEPFHKIEFLNRLIQTVKDPIVVIDRDLLYSGYIESKMIKNNDNVTIFHPDNENWKEMLLEIITKVSKEKFLVVIDSINGVYNMFDGLDSARFINSCIMLLSSIGLQSKSSVIIVGTARKRETGEWILSPGGKQIVRLGNMGMFFLEKIGSNLAITTIQEKNVESKTFTIEKD